MMSKTCLLLLSLSLLSLRLDGVEGVRGDVSKPHKNEDNLYLVDPKELLEPKQNAEQITEQDLADMLSGSGDLPVLDIDMDNSTGTDDVLIGSIHSLVSTISLLLNAIVIVFLCQYPRKFFRQSQSFLILHVCLSSILLVVTMMASASYRLSTNWYFGRFCCKLNNWLKAFGITSQAYFCTLLVVELYFQLRHSSFIQTIESNRTRVKILLVLIGWCLAFVLSYPFWVRTSFYTSGSLTTCSIDTFDGILPADYAYIHNGNIVFNLTMDSVAYDDDDLSLYIDYDYDNQPYECHMRETSFSFRFWYGSLVTFGYFIPLAVIIALFAVLKCTKGAGAQAQQAPNVLLAKAHAKWVWLLTLTYVLCWLPLSIFKAGKVFHGLPLYRDQCLFVRDIGSIMGYFSCLALPAATMIYMVNIRRHKIPSANSTSSLDQEKKHLDEEAALCGDIITNRCDEAGEKSDWH